MTNQPVSWRAILTILAVVPLTGADWPSMFGPRRDSHSTETGLNWAWGKDGPPVAWAKDVGAGFAGVAVADGSLILFHRVEDDEILTALDPATGKEKWASKARTKYRDEFNFDNGPRCVPLVAGGRVYGLGPNGDLHVVEAATGKKLWHRNLLADYEAPKGFFGVGAGPLLVGDRLLVNVGAKGAGIVAFDPATGKELGKASNDAASYSTPISAEIGGKTLAIFLTRQGLLGIDPATMKVEFTREFRARLEASVNAATPLVVKDEVFLTASYNTGAVLLKVKPGAEPEEVWANDKSLSSQYTTPVKVGEYLYGTDGRADVGTAKLRCIEWKTGDVKWTAERFGCASLIAVDGGLLALTERGELVRFDASAEGFKERARAKVLDGAVRAMPALSDGRLFVRDEKRLVCVNLKK